MRLYFILAGLAIVTILALIDFAETAESAYSKIDFEKGCAWASSPSEEEAQMGGKAVCEGYLDYQIYFSEDDLRHFTAYGPVDDPAQFPNGFTEWNSVHDVVEWRLENAKPIAVIQRWFLDNVDPDTGSADADRRGQVLVISTVTQKDAPNGMKVSCPLGYVDARANKNANELAREIADNLGTVFKCGEDRPKFYGIRGPFSGTPNDLAQ
ncbi:MAG: hypothetical protein WBD01_07095 [Salaquimonas sp.]